jgi:hypothetical protein
MDQDNDLIILIQELKEIGVTGASVMYSFEWWIQPLHKRDCFGFKYLETKDPSRMSVEELLVGEPQRRVARMLMDIDVVPYVPQLYNAKNTPK